jgi:hypothetical protein
MGARENFTIAITCPHCSQAGAVVWEENAMGYRQNGVQRVLKNISPGFHAENGRTQSGDPLIVCDICDTIQTD